MRLMDVTLRNLRRRKGRKLLLLIGLTIGVATVVALVAITAAMQADVANKLDEYGANILIVPKANDLSLSYGGVTVASAAFDVGELTIADIDRIQTIKNSRNISVVAPKLLGAIPMGGQSVLVVKEQVGVVQADAVWTGLDDRSGVVAPEGTHGLSHDVAARALAHAVGHDHFTALFSIDQLVP